MLMIYHNAAKQIRVLRAEKGLTQGELAEVLNVSQNYISAVETGTRKPSLQFYIDAANYFHVTLDYLFRDSIKANNNIIIDSVVLKMSYMNESEQKYILDHVESFYNYCKKNKE